MRLLQDFKSRMGGLSMPEALGLRTDDEEGRARLESVRRFATDVEAAFPEAPPTNEAVEAGMGKGLHEIAGEQKPADALLF